MRAARAIVLVTHDMTWAVEFCNHAILLEQGHVVAAGEPADVVRVHETRSEQRGEGVVPEPLPPMVDPGLLGGPDEAAAARDQPIPARSA
jgi:ABC-type hemin transport system ATPase subunit